jgi:hypothetical protein
VLYRDRHSCFYASHLPSTTVTRILDCFFNEGSKIIYRVALGVLKLHKTELMKCARCC